MSEESTFPEPKLLGILKPETHLTTLRYSPCGDLLAAASFDQRIRRWDLRTVSKAPVETDPKKKKKTAPEYSVERMPDVEGHNGFVSRVVFHPSRLIAVSSDTWGGLRSWCYPAEKVEPIWVFPEAHDGWIRDLAMSPDGEWFATCGRDRKVRIFATIDGRLLAEFSNHQEDVFSVAIHPNGKHIVSADLFGKTILQNVETGEVEREYPCDDFHILHRLQDLAGIRRLKFSPKGDLLVIGTIPTGGANFRGQAQVRVIDPESGKVEHDLPMGDASKNAIAHDAEMLPDGTVVAVTTGQSGQGSLIFRNPAEESPRFQLTRGTVNNHSLAISPDFKNIAVAATNSGSAGNGKRLDKEGNYLQNHSPVHVFEMGDS